MDHVKVFSALVNIVLSVWALLLAKNLSGQSRSPIFKTLSLLALTQIVFECYFFVLYYVDVNIIGAAQSPQNLVSLARSSNRLASPIIYVLALALMLLLRVWWFKIAVFLMGTTQTVHVWRWFTLLLALLGCFFLVTFILPGSGTFFNTGYYGFRILWTIIGLIIMVMVLVKAHSCDQPQKKRTMRSFSLLFLGSVLLFFLMFFTRTFLNSHPAPLRFLLEFLYPTYTNLILPLWMWLFLRPWLAHQQESLSLSRTIGQVAIEGLNGREQEILQLILQGKSNHAIADQIFTSEHTVKNTITTIYSKVGVKNRKELFHRFLASEKNKH